MQNFADWLKSLRAEIDKEVDAADRAASIFGEKRSGFIYPILKDAATALQESGTEATAKNANGDSARLEIGEHSLIFRLDGSVIVCASTLLEEEEFDLMPFGEGDVNKKVRDFVARALRSAKLGYSEPPSREGSVILLPRRHR